jgi:hypothetical protein
MKSCPSCGLTLDYSCFGKDSSKKDGLHLYCKKCVNASNRRWYRDNKEKFLESDKAWRSRNIERVRERGRLYCQNKRLYDKSFCIAKRLRVRLRKLVKYNRSGIWELSGCSREELVAHLESQFQPGMTWDNIHEWHIDHIVPLSAFDLTDQEQLKKACHYTNLQPLWAKDNLTKSNKVDN